MTPTETRLFNYLKSAIFRNDDELIDMVDDILEIAYAEDQLSLEQRKIKFVNDVNDIAMNDEYFKANPLKVATFINYWTEHSPKGRLMKWEKEEKKKAFNIKMRLNTWKANQVKFNTVNLATKLFANR